MINRVSIDRLDATVARPPPTDARPGSGRAQRRSGDGMVARERAIQRERIEQWRRNRQRDD